MPHTAFTRFVIAIIIVFSCILRSPAQSDESRFINYTHASVYVPKQSRKDLQKVVEVLREEVSKRTGMPWPVSKKLSKSTEKQIVIALERDLSALPEALQKSIGALSRPKAEGYRLVVDSHENKVIILAKDKRGALYGVGRLLRKMEMRMGEALVPADWRISSSPAYAIRGHQLGYRPKTNAYDAWTPEQFDQYIRELALFGANSIEIMPPRTDDDFTSRHMKLPAIEMIAHQSASCDALDLDVWMWYPNMGSDYTTTDSVAAELAEREEVFAKVPRLDHLFVPGGDPGDLEPGILFEWLKKVAVVLHKYHPNAKIWVSPQVFRPTKEWLDVFFMHVNKKYDWFGGVVFGPWVKMPIDEMRRITHPAIPIRRYPDITHSLSSQYPVPRWDLAWAITLGRECINPRPEDEKMIHNALAHFADGSLSYSEGTNDDVNKFVWSDQDWDPHTPVIETLRDYARFFIGPDYTEAVAQGLMALEQDLRGPLLVNEQVPLTLMQWQAIEQKATPEVLANFRVQMGLIRAYFDAYQQKRLVFETILEQRAKELLADYEKTGIDQAVNSCRKALARAWERGVFPGLKAKCEALADSLYRSIGAQLTVERHGAMSGRGNFIDNIDNPLNDVAWIYSKLAAIEKAQSDDEKKAIIHEILHRTDPGPGGFYDNFGNPAGWERVVVRYDPAADPGNLRTPRVSFGVGLKGTEWVHEVTAKGFGGEVAPMAWMNQVTTLYDVPLEIAYDNLDPGASYIIRVAYTGRFRSRMKMTADGITVHDFIRTGEQPVYEFPVPREALKDGEVIFRWTCGEAERGSQVSEIWLMKK